MASLNRAVLETGPWPTGANFSTFTPFTVLDASGDISAFVFQAQAAVAISRGGFRISSIAGTSPIYRLSLQGVDASGNPDGTVKGGGSPASATFDVSGSGWAVNEWHWVNFANSYTPSRGELLALVIDYSSGTINASNCVAFTRDFTNNYTYARPYKAEFQTAAWSKNFAGPPIFGYGTSTVAYGYPFETNTVTNFNTASSPDEYAQRFQLPAGAGDTYKLAGARIHMGGNAGMSILVKLYDGTTVIASATVDADQVGSNSPSNKHYEVYFEDTTLPTLNFGSPYRLGISSDSATLNAIVYRFGVDAAADMAAYPLGEEVYLSHRVNAGSWTDVTTERLAVGLIIDDWTEPAGGASSTPHWIGG